ncbi:hypothetical protein [Paenibacillus mesotrionivorans]|uniref:Uncharacterized protein n=1 Tax=Paenibacillus mesotrionivorans TaxID=3160968 RepID=A0ACC7P5U9_9BACL
MISFYNSLPWPIYLLVSIGLGTFLVQCFLRNSKKYSILVSAGIILLSISSILAGVVRVFYLLNIKWHLNLIESSPLVGVIGLPLLFVGGYLKTKDDPEKNRIILICTTIASICILMIAFVIIFS